MTNHYHRSSDVGRARLSRRLDMISASGIRHFFDIAATMDDVISLSIGEPDFVTPANVRQAAIDSILAGQTQYTSNFGLLELRQAIASELDQRYGVAYDPASEILVSTGVSEGLNVAMQALLDPGDEVLTADPYYVAYEPNVVFAGGVLVPVATDESDGFQLHVDSLEAALTSRSKLLLLGYPANPTGAVLEDSTQRALAKFVLQHDLYVVVDAIYDRLTYGYENRLFSSLPGMRERTIVLGGFSKSYAMTGWRLGYVAAPAVFLEGIMRVHQYVMMSAPTAAQYAAVEALRCGEDDVQAMVASYDRRRRLIVDGLNRIGLPCFEPRGAFYAFPNITRSGLDDEAFAERLLLEERVAVVPGSAFGRCGSGHVRCCYATSEDDIREALRRIEHFLAHL